MSYSSYYYKIRDGVDTLEIEYNKPYIDLIINDNTDGYQLNIDEAKLLVQKLQEMISEFEREYNE